MMSTKVLKNNLYVDNLIVTGNDPNKMKDLYHNCNDRMLEGGFQLRSWSSNNAELQQTMKDENNYVTHESVEERVLGYIYDTSKDIIKLTEFDLDLGANTKRKILSQIHKIFDPLSLFIPVTLRGKLMLRELWIKKLDWDEIVPNDLLNDWVKLGQDLMLLKNMCVDRCSFVPSDSNTLYIFCDASKACYGFVAYAHNGVNSNLIFSKNKVAPMKTKSLPSLELLSVFLAFKCLDTILDGFPNITFKSMNVFVDAQIVLSWVLTNEPKTKNLFVRNRIKDINTMKLELENKFHTKCYFNYVNTEQNPADLVTHGISAKEFANKQDFWFKGPSWLTEDQSNWPKAELKCLSETSKSKTQNNLYATCVNNVQIINDPIFPIENYSCLDKVMRITALVFKFINKMRKSKLNADEQAKTYWIKRMQSECFSTELSFLLNNPNDRNQVPCLVNQLNLFIDEFGILRSKGRISRSLLYNYDVLNPILIDKSHHLTTLIIWHFHFKCQHLGLQTTVDVLRKGGYWVPRARQAVKNVISDCIICKKFNSLPFKYPKMTNIAKNRMRFVRPFEHTGFDFTGHIFVKDPDTNKSVKMWILIYTCLNIRAIHLDLLPDMSTRSFLLSFERFTNIYGIPDYVYSDNAKSFTVGGKIISESFSSNMFTEHMRKNNIKHVQIPLYSAWVGSTWERLIRVVKSCLYKTVGRAKMTYFELLTSLSNIANVVNSRPLTYRSSDSNLDVISPNSFLQLHGNSNLVLKCPNNDYLWTKEGPNNFDLNKTLDVQEEMFYNFKNQWYDSYLLSLREQSRNLYQTDWTNRIQVGDIVLVQMPNKPRPFWLMGRVLEVVLGFDNKIRSVKLQRSDGTVCHHSICHLYPLELSLTHNVRDNLNNNEHSKNIEINNSDPTPDHGSNSEPRRPLRKAAAKCRQLIRDNLEY